MSAKDNLFVTVLFVIVFILFFLVVFGDRGLVYMHRMERELARIQNANQELERENALLREKMNRLVYDQGYVESYARKELGLVGEDEIIFRFESKKPGGEDSKPKAPAGSQ